MSLTQPTLLWEFFLGVVNDEWSYESERKANKHRGILTTLPEDFLGSNGSPKYSSGKKLVDARTGVMILLVNRANAFDRIHLEIKHSCARKRADESRNHLCPERVLWWDFQVMCKFEVV
jgi:hypothetical protein